MLNFVRKRPCIQQQQRNDEADHEEDGATKTTQYTQRTHMYEHHVTRTRGTGGWSKKGSWQKILREEKDREREKNESLFLWSFTLVWYTKRTEIPILGALCACVGECAEQRERARERKKKKANIV